MSLTSSSLAVGLVWWQGAAFINNIMVALAQVMHGTAIVFAIPPLGALEVTWPIGLAGLVGVYLLLAFIGFLIKKLCEKNVLHDSF